ncbi:MAG: thioredoxin [bacterium]
MAIELTDENFKKEVLEAEIPVVVDFWAPWCGPCRMFAPVIDEVAEEYKEKVKIGKLNVDENRNIAIEYGVMSIPTLKFFNKGQIVNEIIGVVNKDVLKKKLDKLISGV